jgi:hypothetical protein
MIETYEILFFILILTILIGLMKINHELCQIKELLQKEKVQK